MYRDDSRDVSKFDKGDLKDELKSAGFEDCVADNIADRVNDRKTDHWTYGQGREEALREIQMFIDSTRSAYNRFSGTAANRRTTESTSI